MTAPDGGPAAASPAAMLTDAIGRVHHVEQRLGTVASDLNAVAVGQGDLEKATAALSQQLGELQAALDSFTAETASAADEDDETTVVDWSSLDREEAETEWARLYEWLETWLVPTYRVSLNQLRACWTLHPAVREELSWLRVCWAQAYRRPAAAGNAAAEWHARWLPAALDRIAAHWARSECTLGLHEGQELPEHARQSSGRDLSTSALWLHEGRQADVERRPPPQ